MPRSDNVIRFVNLGEIEEAAAAWVIRLDQAGASDADRNAFAEWCDKSELHRAAAARASSAWSDMAALRAFASSPEPQARPRRTPPTWMYGVAAAAASFLILAVAAGLLWTRLAPSRVDVYGAPLGKQEVVTLDDGSTIQLNTASRIEVRYSPERRDVRLLQGEAYFEVAPNASRPFSVYAGDDVVKAVGTAFAVRLRGESTELTLTKGSVELATFNPPQGSVDLAQAPRLARRPLGVIQAASGEAVRTVLVNDALTQPITVGQTQLNNQLAWRHGALAFSGEPLDEVLADVSRYADVDIEIADPRLKNLKIDGYFKTGDVHGVLEALQSSFGVNVEWLDQRHVRLKERS